MSIRSKNPICSTILRSHLAALAAAEGLAPQTIEAAVDAGTMVVLANPAHKGVIPTLIGQPATVKVNANIGTSMFVTDVAMELDKARLARKPGAHALMDQSTAGDLPAIRRDILD
ncbi:phosphomethylpyrimidine synthase ThiC, partial [Solidesulfovibrio sp.]|uniref:phosphomethylpyrimidine synthase ThiC n=1 Tax=Solidesulfovibrio sp. TaxID=2910990 RepID=UPI002B200DFB